MENRAKVGYFCPYLPKEIICTFGRPPVRLLPEARREAEATTFLPRNFCSLVKAILGDFIGGGDPGGPGGGDFHGRLRRLPPPARCLAGVRPKRTL